eukprot:314095-Prorocentrum_minimum.AAC.2
MQQHYPVHPIRGNEAPTKRILKKTSGLLEEKTWQSAIQKVKLTNQKTKHQRYDLATVAAALTATKVGIVVSLVSGLRRQST